MRTERVGGAAGEAGAAAEEFGGPVDEGADLRCQMAVLQVDRGDRHRRGDELGQDFDQISGFEVGLRHETRRLDEAEALEAAGEVGVGVVHRDTAAHLHVHAFAVDEEVPVDHLACARGEVVHREVLREVFERVRQAVAFEVAGCGAGDGLEGADAPRDHARILQVTDADRAVDAFARHVHRAVAHADCQFHVRVAAVEFAQRGDQDQPADRGRHVDA